MYVCLSVCLSQILSQIFIKLSKPLSRPGGPQVIVHWSKERVRVDDVYSVVQLCPNPYWSERCACAAQNLVSAINFENTSADILMSNLQQKMLMFCGMK